VAEIAETKVWFNRVLWFARIERDVNARSMFTSLADLNNKLIKIHPSLQQGAQDREMAQL
jgi:hypothetical protein